MPLGHGTYTSCQAQSLTAGVQSGALDRVSGSGRNLIHPSQSPLDNGMTDVLHPKLCLSDRQTNKTRQASNKNTQTKNMRVEGERKHESGIMGPGPAGHVRP